jgi:hypothetical protein
MNLKAYEQIVRKKKGDFMISRREELIFLGKNNHKLFCKELQMRKKQTENKSQLINGLSMQGNFMSKILRLTPPSGQHYY